MSPIWAGFACVILLVNLCQSYKILVLPILGKSHVMSLTVIAEELIRRGHSVNMVLPEYYPAGEHLESSGIHLERIMHAEGEEVLDYESLFENITQMIIEGKVDVFTIFYRMRHRFEDDCRRLLIDNELLIDKLKGMKFDLAVVEGMFVFRCLYLVPHRLGVPFVTYSDLLDRFASGVPWMTSFVPHQLSSFTDKMSFTEKLRNTALTLFLPLASRFTDPLSAIQNKYRQYGAFDSLDDLTSKSLLWLVTSDVVLDYPKPSMPNVINIGGLSAEPARGQLTSELEIFMSRAKKGIILITFGSQVRILPLPIANKFISTFEHLHDYRIIWRFLNRDNLTIPDNVLLAQWLPQNDLLADSRVKLFITHSGNNGQFEAIYHGVPMIGFPLTGDQPYNAARLSARGYGIAMDIHDFTANQLLSNILKILIDPSYKERTTLASKIFKSALETPAERACYWIEHVIEFGGGHLRSAGLDLNIFQYYMLDLLAFILILLVVIVAAILTCVVGIVRCCKKQKFNAKKKTD